MEDDSSSPIPGGRRDFPSTHWSSLMALGDRDHPDYHQHLSSLVSRYWRPAFSYLRNLRRLAPEATMDLTQEFFTRLLERHSLERLSPDRGSFRGYLKTALRNFSINAHRDETAKQPRGGAKLFPIDPADDEWRRSEPALDQASPEEAFDRVWARGVLNDCVQQLREILDKSGKRPYFELFRAYYLEGGGQAASGEPGEALQDELARRYNLARHDVANHLRYARTVLRRLLVERVAEYLGPGEDPDGELSFLLSR